MNATPSAIRADGHPLAIVMPVYNEEGCIEAGLREWRGVLDRVPGLLIVVDDGSTDRTPALLDAVAREDPRVQVIHQKNAGHGAAVLRGYRQALTEHCAFVFQTDSDGQIPASDFWKLWPLREGSPFVLGFRADRKDAFHRKVISFVMRLWVCALFGVWIRDPNIPFRLMRTEALAAFLELLPADIFAPNILLSVMAAKAGFPLRHEPISHADRRTGVVSLLRLRLLKACFRSALQIARFRVSLFTNRRRLRAVGESMRTG